MALTLASVRMASASVAAVTDPRTNWTAVPIIDIDASNDQQTGQTDADLVGIIVSIFLCYLFFG